MALPTKANVTRPQAWGYGGLLEWGTGNTDCLYLRLAVGPNRNLNIQTAPQRELLDVSQNPEDFSVGYGKVFSRSSFSGGEGLDRAHRRNMIERDYARYWDSRNVDVTPARPGEPERLRLLHETGSISTGSGTGRMACTREGVLYWVGGTSGVDVLRCANASAASPTITVEDPHASEGDQTVLDLASLGDKLYAAITTNGIHVRSSAGVWTHLGAAVGSMTFDFTGGHVEDVWCITGPVAHELHTGDEVEFTAKGTAPTEFTTGVTYYVIRHDGNYFQLASSAANAAAGTQIEGTADSSGGTWTMRRAVPAGVRVWAYKGRIITSTGASLYEVDELGTPTLLETLPSGQTWTDVADAGSILVATSSDGYIYAWTEDNLTLQMVGRTEIEGESPTAVGATQGLIFVGTREPTVAGGYIGRLWRGLVVGTRIRDTQLLHTWGDGTETRDRSPKSIFCTREAAWTATVEDGSETHMWRYHLETGGLSRDLIFSASAAPLSISTVDKRMFIALSATGIYRELTTYATTGWLISPLADFFSSDKKNWVGARLVTDGLVTQETATLYYSTNPDALTSSSHASWTSAVAVTAASGSSTGAITTEEKITGALSRFILGKVVLAASTAKDTTPEVLAFSFRGMLPEVVVEVPISVSDWMERPFHASLRVPGYGDDIWAAVKAREAGAVTLTLYQPSEVIYGILESVSLPVQEIRARGSTTIYALIRVRGVRS